MNLYSVLSFIAFLLYLQAGAIILHKSPRRPVNIVFSILCLSFSIFALFSAGIYSASNVEQVYYYDKLASVGWTTFPALMVLFFVKISNNKSPLVNNLVKYLLFPMAAIAIIQIIAFNELESSKVYYQYGQTWFFELNESSIWVHLFVFYLFFSVGLSLYVLGKWYLSAKTNREKKQVVIILFSLLVFFIASTFSNIFLTYLNISMVPALAPVNSILWISGVFYAMMKYQRDAVSPDVISSLILERINEFLLFFDNNHKIFAANRYTLNSLSYTSGEITGLSYRKIFANEKVMEDYFLRLRKTTALSQTRGELLNIKGEPIPVLLSGIAIRDKYKNNFGYVLIGKDDRQKIKLKQEMDERIRQERLLNKTKNDLGSLVWKNTMELSEANKKLQIEILERKRAEAQIKHDLKEQNSLVSEVHHRVKNNIQIIISLINMLSFHKDINAKGADKLNQIAERVRTISAINEKFYSSENLSKINFSDFLNKTAENLNSTLNRNKNVKFSFNLTEKFLEIDKAIPCGIIYHELLENAIKFAFPANDNEKNNKLKRNNIIEVEFYKNKDEYTLLVSDNGVGIPGETHLLKANSVGLQLVNILTKTHLRGKLEINNFSGTTVKLVFN